MSGGKIIPLIAAGDQAIRDDVNDAIEASVKATVAALDAALTPLINEIVKLRTELYQERKNREGAVPPLND